MIIFDFWFILIFYSFNIPLMLSIQRLLTVFFLNFFSRFLRVTLGTSASLIWEYFNILYFRSSNVDMHCLIHYILRYGIKYRSLNVGRANYNLILLAVNLHSTHVIINNCRLCGFFLLHSNTKCGNFQNVG